MSTTTTRILLCYSSQKTSFLSHTFPPVSVSNRPPSMPRVDAINHVDAIFYLFVFSSFFVSFIFGRNSRPRHLAVKITTFCLPSSGRINNYAQVQLFLKKKIQKHLLRSSRNSQVFTEREKGTVRHCAYSPRSA
jgi:hypothetical protein